MDGNEQPSNARRPAETGGPAAAPAAKPTASAAGEPPGVAPGATTVCQHRAHPIAVSTSRCRNTAETQLPTLRLRTSLKITSWHGKVLARPMLWPPE